jgi:hypothetical protein
MSKFVSLSTNFPYGIEFPQGAGVAQSGYGLNDREIEVRFLAGAEDFSSSVCVQSGYGAHPASWPMGTGGPFLGDKARPGRDADHLPNVVSRTRMRRSFSPVIPLCMSHLLLKIYSLFLKTFI